MKSSIFVVGIDASVSTMFAQKGWNVVSSPSEAEFLCFTGGADVSPRLYGEANHGLSHTDWPRDIREVTIYNEFKDKNKLGICRGGQFLNVMNFGKMVQDLPVFHSGIRNVLVKERGTFDLHEDHHQGMIPAAGAELIGVDSKDLNPEIVWYSGTRSFCFQAHPEWGNKTTSSVFFELIERYFA